MIVDKKIQDKLHLISGRTKECTLTNNQLLINEQILADLLGQLEKLSIPERAMIFLENIGRLTKFPGHEVTELNPEIAYSLSYSNDPKGFLWNLKYLEENGFIEITNDTYQDRRDLRLTIKGYGKIDELNAPNLDSPWVFIAMSFSENPSKSLDTLFSEGIKPAIKECGFKPNKVNEGKRGEDLGKIDDRIIADIKQSRFLVADFTEQKGGVYFEAGLAQGFGIPVIWTCKDDEEERKKLHFDTRQYNHIFWKDPEDLRKRLIDRIRANIGKGPIEKPKKS